MYKQIYGKIKLILVSPEKFWIQLSEKDRESHVNITTNFVYPLLGLIAISSFIGSWWNNEVFDLQRALQIVCVNFVAGFAGFFVASFLVDEFSAGFLTLEKNIIRARNFVGYSSVVLYVIVIFWNIVPNYFFIFLFLFYTVYIVWEGSEKYMQIENKDRLKFTIVSSLLIVGAPFIIEKILLFFLPGI